MDNIATSPAGLSANAQPGTDSPKGNPATRTHIMDAAERVLDRKSILDATVDDFVQEAALARGTFYIYFKDKFDLLGQLARRQNDRLFNEAHVHIDRNSRAIDRIRVSLRRVIQSWQEHAGLFRSTTQVALLRPDFLALHQELRFPFIQQIRHDLESSIARGHARPIDTAVAAKALAAMMDWFCLLWFGLAEPPYKGADQDVEHVTDHLTLLWYRSIYGTDPA